MDTTISITVFSYSFVLPLPEVTIYNLHFLGENPFSLPFLCYQQIILAYTSLKTKEAAPV